MQRILLIIPFSFLLALIGFPLSCRAEAVLKQMVFTDSSFRDASANTRAVKLIKRADYVSTTINLSTAKTFKDSTLMELKNDLDTIRKAIENNKMFSTYSGPMRFRSRGKSFVNEARSGMVILAKLGPDGYQEPLLAASELRKFYQDIKPQLKTESSMDDMRLAIHDPEQYRGAILKKLADDIRQTKESFNGKATVKVTGLNGPVDVYPSDDAHLELSIDYDLSMSIED